MSSRAHTRGVVGFIGFGVMGQAIGSALARAGTRVYYFDIKSKLLPRLPLITPLKHPGGIFQRCKIIIVSIKPQDMPEFFRRYRDICIATKPLIVTIAAGLPLALYEKQLPGVRVIRVMPNLAARVGKAISFIARGALARAADVKKASAIFARVGTVVVIDEARIDQATAVAGCGPGLLYHCMHEFVQAAQHLGFSLPRAEDLVKQMFVGSAELARISDKGFGVLADEVTSKKGMTESGRAVLSQRNTKKIFSDAVRAAYVRGREIAKKYKAE